jgi:hypothetical protein
MTMAAPSLAENARPSEYEVKAAYLYNFGKFLSWPAQSDSSDKPFQICVLGEDPFGPTLDAILAGEKIGGDVVIARRIRSAQEAASCRILFISASEISRIKIVLETLRAMPVLTVSDMPDFLQYGGMIRFVLDGDRVRFEVSLVAAEKAHLGMSSQLLKVATAVRK